MDRTRVIQNWIFMIVIAVVVVGFTLTRKPIVVSFGNKIQSVDVKKVCSDIANIIGVEELNSIYVKRMDAVDSQNSNKSSGDPAFILTIYPDGTIYRIMWNMFYKDEGGTYQTFQVNGGKAVKKAEDNIVIGKSVKTSEVGKNNLLLEEALSSFANIPIEQIIKNLPQSEFYMMRVQNYYPEGCKIPSVGSRKVFYVNVEGNIKEIEDEDLKNVNKPLIQIPVALSDSKGHGKDSGATILLEVKK